MISSLFKWQHFIKRAGWIEPYIYRNYLCRDKELVSIQRTLNSVPITQVFENTTDDCVQMYLALKARIQSFWVALVKT